jgi:hypothetical protein
MCAVALDCWDCAGRDIVWQLFILQEVFAMRGVAPIVHELVDKKFIFD